MRQRGGAALQARGDAKRQACGHPNVSRLNGDRHRGWKESEARDFDHVRRERSREPTGRDERRRRQADTKDRAPQPLGGDDSRGIQITHRAQRTTHDERSEPIERRSLGPTVQRHCRRNRVIELRTPFLDEARHPQIVRHPMMRPCEIQRGTPGSKHRDQREQQERHAVGRQPSVGECRGGNHARHGEEHPPTHLQPHQGRPASTNGVKMPLQLGWVCHCQPDKCRDFLVLLSLTFSTNHTPNVLHWLVRLQNAATNASAIRTASMSSRPYCQ